MIADGTRTWPLPCEQAIRGKRIAEVERIGREQCGAKPVPLAGGPPPSSLLHAENRIDDAIARVSIRRLNMQPRSIGRVERGGT